MVFYGNQRQLEYDVVVSPDANPSDVAFRIEGAKDVKIDDDGGIEIVLNTGGSIIQKRPHIYQEIEGKRVEIEGKYTFNRFSLNNKSI